MFNAERIGL